MAEKLVKYYAYIAEKKGVMAKVELAKRTVVPSILAATIPDSPENIKIFKDAIQLMTGVEAPDF
jgi:hypothetical protein